MMPNIDPKQLKKMMDSMGIKSSEVAASRVVIETSDKDIVIENPQILQIDARGSRSFQIQGEIREVDKVKLDVSDEDLKLVMESSGVDDVSRARAALEVSNGDIAQAILKLKEG